MVLPIYVQPDVWSLGAPVCVVCHGLSVTMIHSKKLKLNQYENLI